MATVVPLRLNDGWVNLVGCLDSPRYIFIVDKIAKHAISNLETIGVDSRNMIVQITKGDFESLDKEKGHE